MAAPRKVLLTLESRKSVELPLSSLMQGGEVSVFPHVEARGYLFLQFRKGKVLVTAGKYVGLIPLTPTISVDVRPKLPVSNLARVLDQARVSLDTIDGADRLYMSSGQPSISVLEFLLNNFVDSLRPIEAMGLHKKYVRRSAIMNHPRGRIKMAGTLRSCWSRGIRHQVEAERFEHTADIPVNRLLKAALEYLLHGLRRAKPDRALLRRANEAHHSFPEQVRSMTLSDYDSCRVVVSDHTLPGGRAYYYRALEIALLVLSGHTVSLDKAGDDVLLDSFTVDFEAVFEQYLRRTLLAHAPGDVAVKDGNHDGKKPLYDDRNDPPAQPDIVIERRGSSQRVVAEVKYKDKVERPDINQAVTYALSYRTDRVVLVHQCKIAGQGGLRRLGTINGVQVETYGFDLANPDLQAEEVGFSEKLFGLLPASENAFAA